MELDERRAQRAVAAGHGARLEEHLIIASGGDRGAAAWLVTGPLGAGLAFAIDFAVGAAHGARAAAGVSASFL